MRIPRFWGCAKQFYQAVFSAPAIKRRTGNEAKSGDAHKSPLISVYLLYFPEVFRIGSLIKAVVRSRMRKPF